MKLVPALLSAAAVAALFYVGHSVNTVGRSLADRFDRLPATAGAAAGEAVKGGVRQFDKEVVNAPAEIGKAALAGTAKTAEKGYKDSVKEVKRMPGHVNTFADRVTGGRVHLW